MTTISFTVPTIPIAQPRPRAVSINGHARVFSAPSKHPVNAFKASVQASLERAYQGPPLAGPVCLVMTFHFPRTKQMTWKTREMKPCWKLSKPDLDNVEKAAMDALNGLAWIDDAQVVEKHTRKLYCCGATSPRVEVLIEELTEEVL